MCHALIFLKIRRVGKISGCKRHLGVTQFASVFRVVCCCCESGTKSSVHRCMIKLCWLFYVSVKGYLLFCVRFWCLLAFYLLRFAKHNSFLWKVNFLFDSSHSLYLHYSLEHLKYSKVSILIWQKYISTRSNWGNKLVVSV